MIKKNNSEHRVTYDDIAKLAKVSKATVSKAFNNNPTIPEATKNKIKKIAADLSYTPNLLAISLATKKSMMIGLVVDELENPFVSVLIQEISLQLQNLNFIPLIINISNNYTKALLFAEQAQVEAFLFIGTFLDTKLLNLIKNIKRIPLIVLCRDTEESDLQIVTTDSLLAGKEIADLFIKCGYKSFGYVYGPMTNSVKLKRVDGYTKRLSENNYKLDVSLNLPSKKYKLELAKNLIHDYLIKNKGKYVDAFFCENDIIAIAFLDALKYLNLANKIAIVGFDNTILSSLDSYNLTSYDQPIKKIVEAGLNRINNQLGNIKIKGKLVLRHSHLKW